MDRRTDRTVGLVTIIAVAVVPTAVLALGKVGNATDGGSASESAIKPVVEEYPGAPKFLPTPTAPPAPPKLPPGFPDTKPPKLPPAAQPAPENLKAYTRATGMVTFKASGGGETTQETADFTTKPFTMKATTKKLRMVGKKWKLISTTKVQIKGNRKATRVNGGKARYETLSKPQLDKIKADADPRTLTTMVDGAFVQPEKTYDKKLKLWKYRINVSLAQALTNFPEFQKSVPPAALLLGMDVINYADTQDRTRLFSITGAPNLANPADFASAVGLGVIFSNLR